MVGRYYAATEEEYDALNLLLAAIEGGAELHEESLVLAVNYEGIKAGREVLETEIIDSGGNIGSSNTIIKYNAKNVVVRLNNENTFEWIEGAGETGKLVLLGDKDINEEEESFMNWQNVAAAGMSPNIFLRLCAGNQGR